MDGTAFLPHLRRVVEGSVEGVVLLDEQLATDAPPEVRHAIRWLAYMYAGMGGCLASLVHLLFYYLHIPLLHASIGVLLGGGSFMVLGLYKAWPGARWAWERQRANRRAAEDAADIKWWYDELTPEERIIYEREHGKPDLLI